MDHIQDTSKVMAVVLLLTGMLLGIMAIDRSEQLMASIDSLDVAFAIGYAQGY